MLKISITDLEPAATRLTGAIIGESHASAVRRAIASSNLKQGDSVALDFGGIESASASYLKRLLTPFFSSINSGNALAVNVAPVIVNAEGEDLIEDLEDFLGGRGRVLIVAREKQTGFTFDRIIGQLEQAASETFRELCTVKKTTAQELYERHPNRTTNQTAWNNRLLQLVELRIARRHREGRCWIYQPTVTI